MSDPPTPLSMERGGKGKTAIPEEEKADEPSILPMTPESKQLAAVIATAVATAMACRGWPKPEKRRLNISPSSCCCLARLIFQPWRSRLLSR